MQVGDGPGDVGETPASATGVAVVGEPPKACRTQAGAELARGRPAHTMSAVQWPAEYAARSRRRQVIAGLHARGRPARRQLAGVAVDAPDGGPAGRGWRAGGEARAEGEPPAQVGRRRGARVRWAYRRPGRGGSVELVTNGRRRRGRDGAGEGERPVATSRQRREATAMTAKDVDARCREATAARRRRAACGSRAPRQPVLDVGEQLRCSIDNATRGHADLDRGQHQVTERATVHAAATSTTSRNSLRPSISSRGLASRLGLVADLAERPVSLVIVRPSRPSRAAVARHHVRDVADDAAGEHCCAVVSAPEPGRASAAPPEPATRTRPPSAAGLIERRLRRRAPGSMVATPAWAQRAALTGCSTAGGVLRRGCSRPCRAPSSRARSRTDAPDDGGDAPSPWAAHRSVTAPKRRGRNDGRRRRRPRGRIGRPGFQDTTHGNTAATFTPRRRAFLVAGPGFEPGGRTRPGTPPARPGRALHISMDVPARSTSHRLRPPQAPCAPSWPAPRGAGEPLRRPRVETTPPPG